MASKLRLITDLYGETLTQISQNPDDWMSFLECAAMNYKYPFNDQVLIYAQRPEAVACAKIEAWNKQVGRWVNRGAKGIALLTEATITSPMLPLLLNEPPRTRIHIISLAPVLSATFNLVCGCIITPPYLALSMILTNL